MAYTLRSLNSKGAIIIAGTGGLMKRLGVVALVVFWYAVQGAAQGRIEDFRSRYNRCDYLVVCPQVFSEQAMRLVEHRNSFAGDDVHNARLVITEELVAEFRTDDTPGAHEALWRAFKHAYENWYEPLKYIVLIGADSIHWDSTGAILTSYGLMPSFHNGYYVYYSAHRDTFVRYTDDYYLTLDLEQPRPSRKPEYNLPLSTGRIPCETSEQLGNYIDKVIRYDYSFESDSRGNRALVLADDTRQGGSSDPLGFAHFRSAEQIAQETVLDKLELTKLYLSMFSVNERYRHEDARQVFLDQIDRGQKWVLFFGHGCPGYISDEVTVHADDVDYFDQDSEPFFFFSFSCRNGAYHIPYEQSMCKRFLFRGRGGALAFMASSALEYSTPSRRFADHLFSILDTVPDISIGQMTTLAKRNSHNLGIQHYHLLGDPAIRVQVGRIVPQLSFDGTQLSVQVDESSFGSGTYYVTVSSIDTLKLPEDTNCSFVSGTPLFADEKIGGNQVFFELPEFDQEVKVNVYVRGAEFEGRADTSAIIKRSSGVIPQLVSVPGEIHIQNSGGQLRVHYAARRTGEPVNIILFDLRGRKILQKPIASSSGSVFNLRKQGVGPGNYLLMIKEGDRTVVREDFVLVH